MPEPAAVTRHSGGQETTAAVKKQGGGREATALWAAVMGVSVGEAWLRRHEPQSPEQAAKFEAALEHLRRGVPFAYVVGRAGFRMLELAIDSRALIPRPETEGLVDLVLEWGKGDGGRGKGGVAADIGTGCGCIALALAQEGNFERVIAVERSPQAAALARENVELVRPPPLPPPSTPVEVREGDLLEPLAGARFRVIVSNPPYLSEADYDALDESVKRFEPRDALVGGGPDGLGVIHALLAGAGALLEPRGMLALEIDARRGDRVRALAHEHGWAGVSIHNDLFGRPRYALAFRRED